MQIKKQIEKVKNNFPELIHDEKTHTLKGELEVFPKDFYSVSIELHPWNEKFPKVYEIGERIPKKTDRHIYTDDGGCCFTTPRLEEVYLKTKVKTLMHFFNHILIPYLQNNSYFELHLKYKYGEFSHTDATLESYQTLLEINDSKLITKILYQYHEGHKLGLKDRCYCGSNQTLRKCSRGRHRYHYESLKHIKKQHMTNDIKILMDELIEKNMKTN